MWHIWGTERCIQGFGGETWGWKPLERPRHRWEDNIKMDMQDMGWESVDWTDLARDRDRWQALVMAWDRDRWQALVDAVMNLQVPWTAGNFSTSHTPVTFSGRTLLHGVVCCKLYIFIINKPALKIQSFVTPVLFFLSPQLKFTAKITFHTIH